MHLVSLVCLATLVGFSREASPPSQLYDPLVAQKLLTSAQSVPNNPIQYPQYTSRDNGQWQYFPADYWTTGFLPAACYALYTRFNSLCPNSTAANQFLELGRGLSTGEVPLEAHTTVGHDVGFLSFPFVDEVAIDKSNQTAVTAVNTFATLLADRFNAIVGCTRSWDTSDPTDFQVIIDNMMNLQVLFDSEALTGNTTLRDIAMSHADKTMQNHVRPDGSSYHVVEYNSTTGDVIRRRTAQGYADNSTWTRGQAWGVYGFANMYRNTQQTRYLDTARQMASYYISQVPSDGIVPWDFNAPLDPPRPADSSAAMIATVGLLMLSQQEASLSPSNTSGAQYWSDAAIKLLSDNTAFAWKPEWQSLLSNGTVNNPASPPNNLTGIIYGDHYFIEAGNQLISMGLANCSNSSSTSPAPSSPPTTQHTSGASRTHRLWW
ncbi:d-4,5 unsaturated-glucuronyl hydrolase-like protein [Heliocybe sulcata]|uniref:D-4,5 unsaturated-glucuronyl hydrolase-like protein n=1 Tax=Heliocybe sulcata TaxID=5364 RepID=A0A5C3MNT5_9AGAM|nr:d-4,5 unsaturated-glucuronyl hydrolase-like protein [Heliocybe sulcata]